MFSLRLTICGARGRGVSARRSLGILHVTSYYDLTVHTHSCSQLSELWERRCISAWHLRCRVQHTACRSLEPNIRGCHQAGRLWRPWTGTSSWSGCRRPGSPASSTSGEAWPCVTNFCTDGELLECCSLAHLFTTSTTLYAGSRLLEVSAVKQGTAAQCWLVTLCRTGCNMCLADEHWLKVTRNTVLALYQHCNSIQFSAPPCIAA